MAKVAVLSLGGTIAMGEKAVAGGVKPSLSADDLISAVPGLTEIAEIETYQICNIPSVSLSWNDLFLLNRKIQEFESEGFDGVVITQGTDTIEETSWVLDLICRSRMGIVVTGAMRNPTQPGADGAANLLSSVQVAARAELKDLGAVVVFNDQIHAARFVQKSHTSSLGAFTSSNGGPLGWVSEGRPILPFSFKRTKPLELECGASIPVVPIVKPALGDDGSVIDLVVQSGVHGLVLEAAGGGHVSESVADAAERAVSKVPVVLSSRTRSGCVLSNTYGFVGSEMDLLARGLIGAGNLDSLKARILVLLSLAQGIDEFDLRRIFASGI